MDTTCIPQGSIVVGVDDSPAGERAVTWAADEAALEHRPLVLLHATGSLGTPGTVWLTESDRVVQEARDHGHQLLVAASERIAERHPSLDRHLSVVSDDARGALLASAGDAQLLVVGSRGRGPVRTRLLGSVSAEVVRHATCPVVVVRPHHPGAVRRGVLVGADGSVGSLATLEFAYRQASVRGLPLTVVHCVSGPVPADSSTHVVPADRASLEAARLLLAESVAGLSEAHPDVHVTLTATEGLPALRLELASAQMDLLVVGRHQASSVSRVLSGDLGLHVVEHGHTVVAVVPETPEVPGPTNRGQQDLVP
jgi:nucleotide-binding universal stress UspA family protein